MVQVQQRILRLAVLLPLCALAQRADIAEPKFFPDDPLLREPPPLTIGKAFNREINDYYDFFQNTFFPPDKEEIKHHTAGPSLAVNTLGEVPDSAWFTNRIGSRPMSIEELVRGPGDANPPAMDKPWTVISGKNEGITPGLVIRDSKGRKYFLKFDPKTNPEMASAADVVGSKFFYDLGYNGPENYIVRFTRNQLTVNEKSTYKTPDGKKRAMTARDVDDVLAKSPREKEGLYRGLASLTISGDIIGPFRYYGTRKDDPNDIVDHENRRDLRGLYVFAAWLNHTDSKSINSLDSVVEEDGRRFIKHFLIDFGAILGSDSFEAKNPRRGNVYVFDWPTAARQFLSIGFYVPAWMRADYPHLPEVGRFEYETFDPRNWRSNYPNPAFELHNSGDAFWAAKKVMAFSDDAIRAIVSTAQYGDPRAAEWLAKCLIERRNKIGRAFFEDVLPLDGFELSGGKLTFDDLAARYGFRKSPVYSVQWFEYDNRTDARTPIPGGATFDVPRTQASYLAARIQAADPRKTVTVYLHEDCVVGIDRTW
jgi:hypothetical protein